MSRQLRIAFVLGALGCTSATATPAVPPLVVALADAYEHPSATLTPATANMVVDQSSTQREVLQAISGLRFIRDIVADATSLDADVASIDVRGALDAHAPCPGWDASAPPDEARDGFIDVSIGIQESRVQRAFTGRATNCRFVTESAGAQKNAVASMDLEIDLGGSLGLGEPTPPILVRATNLSGAVGGVALALGQQVVSFRLRPDDSIETLVNMSMGTALLALRADGHWALRARDSAWVCSAGGSASCVRDAAALP